MTGAPRARTAVVHLVRETNGFAPFEVFIASLERCDARLEHDLVLLFKGFAGTRSLRPYLERAAALRPTRVEVDDDGFDLTAYAAAASALEHERLCFVNSFSEALVPGWLALLDAALDDPEVGAAGATGSWASHLSYGLYQLGMPGEYARALPGRRAARVAMHELAGAPLPRGGAHWLYTLLQTARTARGAGRFPVAHLRTNAFVIERTRFLDVATRTRTKWDAYRLESGPHSISARLRDVGTPPVVVDARGAVRAPADWHRADVFFQAGQEDLLVADNRTRSYASATPAQRAVLSAFAWGQKARPAP